MLLHELFAASAAEHPERVAIDVPPGRGRPSRRTVTYAALARDAAAVARGLAPLVGRECSVAVLLPRDSPDLWAAQIGILRAGAAHLCLDPAFPDAHVEHVLRDSGAVALVTDARGAARRLAAGAAVLDVSALLATSGGGGPGPRPWQGPQCLAYVIYTSGTTGKPKGLLLEHAGIVNLVRSGVERFRIGTGDRIAQGSSPAYDSSLEETWLALAAGATVVVLDDETVRMGPDLVPWLRAEKVTVLCPPPTLLRAMDCPDPARELPDLRLCYAGGEAMPQDLADLWGGASWLENGYGPTECTVTAVRGRLRPGEPVTIGTPVPGMRVLLLDEGLVPVGDGEVGELCLAGIGLARGYLGQEELTSRCFVYDPRHGRIYRTGDLARRERGGAFVCLGRSDAQVKLRGYRIELEAIEQALAACQGVREAACRVQGDGEQRALAAFVVPDRAGEPPAPLELERALRAALPEYMVPRHFAAVRELPRTIGGKLDRKALPELRPAERNGDAAAAAPEAPGDATERRVAAAIAHALALPDLPAPGSDFFALGGDSLRAAIVVSRLRRDPRTAAVTVRDVYEARTPAEIARRARPTVEPGAPSQPAGPAGAGHPLLVTLAQSGWLLATLLLGSALAYLIAFEAVPALWWRLGAPACFVLAPLFATLLRLAWAAASVWLAVLAKELLIGTYRPLRTPVWGSFHLRHWIVVRTARLVPIGLVAGTPLHAVILRALGARIGRRVHIDRDVDLMHGGWDLLEIGDDAALCRESSVGLVELDAGHLVVGPARIGSRATLEARSGVGPETTVGADAELAALAYLEAGASIPDAERWDGVPARPAGRAEHPPAVDAKGRELGPRAHGLALVALRTLLPALLAAPLTLLLGLALEAGVGADAVAAWLGHGDLGARPAWIAAAALMPCMALPFVLLAQALLLRWTRGVPAGTTSRWSLSYLRLLLRTGVLESAGEWLSGTLFWPLWLRLAGMRIGTRCEVSTILDVLPEHVEIGAWSFLADGIYLGVPRIRAGTVTVGRTVLGERTFLGNHVVVPGGQRLPDDLLLGVCTVADERVMRAAGSWFGHPPFALPRREVVTLDRRLTHEPGPVRFGNRVFWEALRMLVPAVPVLLGLAWCAALGAAADSASWTRLAVAVPVATLAAAAASAAFVLVLKWVLLGRVRPGTHGLWSCWASRWDFLYVVWNRYGRALLAPLEGTLLLAWFLRATGMRIGRRVVLGDGFAQVVDPDMLALEDGATVHALFQAHSFEDRVLKIDRVRVGKGATVGRGAVLLYGSDVGERARVAPHSVVMKGEHLLPGRHYAGAPTAEGAPPETRTPVRAAPAAARLPDGRDAALDLARGLAVLGMIFVHFVPTDGDGTWLGGACALVGTALHGKVAALFCVLAGIAWAIQAQRLPDAVQRRRWFARRALALGAAGLVLWKLVWPTEVLLPLALMMPCVAALSRRGIAALLVPAAALVAAIPFATLALGASVDGDWHDDGLHLANTGFGWATVRYFLLNGNYPLLPWLAFPLLGAALARGGYRDPARRSRWLWLALPLAAAAQAWIAHADASPEALGALEPYLGNPLRLTSVPFALLLGSASVTVVAAASWWQARRGLPAWTRLVSGFGRASLTHYLAHLLAVYVPLRHFWPAEDWPVGTGLAAAAGYVAVALPLTGLWLRRFRRGPVEALLARLSESRRGDQ